MEERWSPIDEFDGLYWISTQGRCKRMAYCIIGHKRRQNKERFLNKKITKVFTNGYKGKPYYAIYYNGKNHNRYISQLLAINFISIPIRFNNGSRKRHKTITRCGGERYYAENIIYATITGPRKKKLREPQPISVTIDAITINTNVDNQNDNQIIVSFLKGEDQKIWSLYFKYKPHWTRIYFKIRDWYKDTRKRKRGNLEEMAMECDDVLMECFIVLIQKIKEGYFDGRKFKEWSGILIRNRLISDNQNRLKPLLRAAF